MGSGPPKFHPLPPPKKKKRNPLIMDPPLSQNPGRFAPDPVRPLDVLPQGRFAPAAFRPLVVSPLVDLPQEEISTYFVEIYVNS